MRRKTRVLAVLLAAIPLLPTPINFVQNSFGANSKDEISGEVVDEGNGVLATKVQTPEGLLTVNLPSDLSQSDTISGTVVADAAGQTPEEQQKNTDEIGGYVVEIEKAEPAPDPTPVTQVAVNPPPQGTPPANTCTPPVTSCTPQKKKHPPKNHPPVIACNPPQITPPPTWNPPQIFNPPTMSCSPPPMTGCAPPMTSGSPAPMPSCTPANPPTTSCFPRTGMGRVPQTGYVTPTNTGTQGRRGGARRGPVQATAKNPGFSGRIPRNTNAVDVVIRNRDGKVISRTPVKVNSTPPEGEVPSGTAMLPTVGTQGRPVRIRARTSGDSRTGLVKIGGRPCMPIVKSPRGVVVNTPHSVTGKSDIEFTEGNMTAKAPFVNLQVHASCNKTVLDKGESSTIVVQVTGTEGLNMPVTLRITNTAPSVVSLSGGDRQTIKINPGQ